MQIKLLFEVLETILSLMQTELHIVIDKVEF